MPAHSKFHDIYLNNKIEIDEDARLMTQSEFMCKYHIWTTTYFTYFRWASEAMKHYKIYNQKMRDVDLRERHDNIMKKARERQDQCLWWFTEKVNSVAEKFWVTVETIILLTKDYWISEIEKWYIENWKIVIKPEDEIKMADPGDITNSMSGRWRSIV